MPTEYLCFICEKIGADMELASSNVIRYAHKSCCLTEEEVKKLIRIMRRFQNAPAEEH